MVQNRFKFRGRPSEIRTRLPRALPWPQADPTVQNRSKPPKIRPTFFCGFYSFSCDPTVTFLDYFCKEITKTPKTRLKTEKYCLKNGPPLLIAPFLEFTDDPNLTQNWSKIDSNSENPSHFLSNMDPGTRAMRFLMSFGYEMTRRGSWVRLC